MAEAEERLRAPGAVRNFLLQYPVMGDAEEVAIGLTEWATSASIGGICLSFFEQKNTLELIDQRFMERFDNELDSQGKSLVVP